MHYLYSAKQSWIINTCTWNSHTDLKLKSSNLHSENPAPSSSGERLKQQTVGQASCASSSEGSKISKIVGIIARLRHHVPLNTLLQIYHSLIFPYPLYGVPVWGQASQCDLKKILTLQKCALRLIFFASKRSHAIPLFVTSNI